MENKNIWQKVKDHFVLFLAKQVNPPPLLFFFMYLYFHLKLQSPDYIAYTFFVAGLLFALLFSYNHFYLYSPVLNAGIGYWSILNLFLGILAANQKWKLYLYLFIIGDSLTIEYPSISKIYVICCSLYLWIDIYRNLTFKTVSDNIIFFTGFFTIFIFQLFLQIISSVDGYTGIPYFTVPFSILIGYKLISNRIQNLKKKSILKMRNVQQVNHYINLIKDQIKSPYSREGYLQTHKDNCVNVQCFCRNVSLTDGQIEGKINFKTKMEYFFIRNLFQQTLNLKSIPKKQFLYNKFIDFLIQNGQVTQAIQFYTKLECLSAKFYYFRWVQRVRLYNRIQQKLEEFDYFNIFSKQFVYVFKYDNSYLYLASEIKQILKTKVQFWKQVGRQTPLMVQLQSLGSKIVQRMYDLNNFYYKQIKQQEQKINNFNGTIMYAMYLLSTTNYKEFAESLIKNTSRTLQSIKIHEDNIAQTYGLKILIRDSKKSCNQKIQILDSIVDSDELQRFLDQESQLNTVVMHQKQDIERAKRLKDIYSHGFVQIITNVSGSLCKLLKTSKNDMLGKDLNTILPSSYQQRHHAKLQKLLHYDSKLNKQLINLSFINKLRQVPLKTIDGKLITAKISVKIYEGIQEGISFIALVQTVNQNKVTIITNIDGEIQQFEQGLSSMKILQSRQVSKVVAELKEEWETEYKISAKKINFTFNDNNYSVSFSSPYQSSFLEKVYHHNEQSVQSEDEAGGLISSKHVRIASSPPIHIDVVNQSIPYLANAKQDREQQMTKCIKKMESVFYKTDIDSQASTNSSRKSSVVNVLMSFSENFFIPFYGYIMGVFALILIGSIAASSVGYSQLGLEWDNSIPIKNPIINVISTMHIRCLMIKTINHQYDLIEYLTNPLVNKTNIDYFYGLDKTHYPTYVQEQMRRIQVLYKESIVSTSMYVSDVLTDKMQKAWQLQIPTVNYNNPDPDNRVQNLPLQSIFMNYLVDLDLLSLGKSFSKTIISLNFWSIVQYVLDRITSVNENIQASINKTILLNIVYSAILAICFAFSILPVYALLKKRVKRHIDIYDLIVSVEGQQIKQEIKKLDNIIVIVNNSNQSSEVLKTNTINYLARKRSSALNENIVGSNQMIEGLIQSKNDSITEQEAEAISNQQELGLQTKSGFLLKKQQNLQSTLKKSQISNLLVGQQTKKIMLRKRSGQLDLKNSEGDVKRIVCKHWILYILILTSTFALFTIVIIKINNYNLAKITLYDVESFYTNFIDQTLLLLNAKMFFRGMPKVDFTYHDTTFIKWLEQNVYLNSALQFNSNYQDEKVYAPCLNVTGMNRYMFCRQNYSLLTLRQSVDHFIKESYQRRYELLQVSNTIAQSQLKDFSQHFFFIQSMSDRISNITDERNLQALGDMFKNNQNLNQNLEVIFVIGLSWGFICLIFGVFLINYMKKLYFKEIIIVSFLNTEMISKNKRVQSFLQTLSKSSY